MSHKKLIATILLTAISTFALTVTIFYTALGMNEVKSKDLLRFFGALRFIETQYVGTVEYTKLIDGAIEGMVKTLNDPHSAYLGAEMYSLLKEYTEGQFGGIGVVMGFKDEKVSILSVLEGTPGESAGLKVGDEILAVNHTPTSEMQSEEVAMHIRGEVGTEVTLTIHRDDAPDQDITITRDLIQVHTALGQMLEGEDGIGYIRIASFSDHTAEEFSRAYDQLQDEGMKGLILDLRENSGGLVTACVDIANRLVPKGTIVSVVNKDGKTESYTSNLAESKYPIVVLIDGNSASASEILAGALQDTKAATLVGTTSYGKGSVQVVMPLLDDDALKLTIAKYYTPSGRSIDGTGIEPDIRVERDTNAAVDNQLLRAIDEMKKKIQEKA